jgi:tetratricopeptide (TPR) repeat protein
LAAAVTLTVLAITASALFAVQARRAAQGRLAERRQSAIDKALVTAWTGDLDATEQSIRGAELAGASVADLRMLRGSVAMHRGDYREAMQHLEQAWKLSPKSVAVASMLIKAYSLLGEWDKAQPIFENLYLSVPTTPEDFLFRGSLEAMVDPMKAMETLNEAIRRRPTGIAGLVRGSVRASVALDAARIDEAEAAIADINNAATALLPANAEIIALSLHAHLIAAGIYEDNQMIEKRAAAWRQVEADAAALEKYPGNQAAILARAMYLKHVAHDSVPFRELRASAPNGLTDYCLAVALYREGEFKAALDLLQPAVSLNQTGADYARGYFMAELPNGPELALKEFYRLWQGNPSTWTPWQFRPHFVC